MSTIFTLRIDDELKQQLDDLSQATQRSKSFLASEALREYLSNEAWLIAEIREGQRQVRAGMTVSGEEMDILLASLEIERTPKLAKSVRLLKTKKRAG